MGVQNYNYFLIRITFSSVCFSSWLFEPLFLSKLHFFRIIQFDGLFAQYHFDV